MPPSPLVLNTTLDANSVKNTTNLTYLPLNLTKAQQHEQAAPSEFVTVTKATTTIAAPSSASAFPSSTVIYYPGMPGGGLLGADSASDSHAGVAVGVSCGILGFFLIAIAIGFAKHIQRSAKNEALRLAARGVHDNFRLQPVSGQQHRQNRQRQRHRLQSEAGQLGHQDLQVELARQWQVHHPIRILRTPGPEGKS